MQYNKKKPDTREETELKFHEVMAASMLLYGSKW